MPTNEERRSIAQKLRVLADENTVTSTPNFNHTLFAALGGEPPAAPSMPTLRDLEAYDKALLYRLADLIEPEQERTCKMTKKGPEYVLGGWFECSECGVVYPPCNDDISAWALQYCPRCGAKVIGG